MIAPGLVGAHLGYCPEDLAGRRVGDVDGRATIGIGPSAVDIALLAEQALVLKLHVFVLREWGQARGAVFCSRL